MMRLRHLLLLLIVFITSCQRDDDNRLFEKTADQRKAEAIQTLKEELTANPWRVNYQPEDGTGSYWVLLNFNDDNTVRIRTDLGTNNGEFFDQTITYRIDSSLGLELIFESYSFFSFLAEQGAATLLAEYEFNYVNKTPDNALVFVSKTDPAPRTVFTLLPSTDNDVALLGQSFSRDMNAIVKTFDNFTPVVAFTYAEKDLVLYITVDDLRRNLYIYSASLKSNVNSSVMLNFNTSYVHQGDSLIFTDPFNTSVLGNSIRLRSLKYLNATETTMEVCGSNADTKEISAVTSSGEAILLKRTLNDPAGRNFSLATSLFFGPVQNIFIDGQSQFSEIPKAIAGATQFYLLYNFELANGSKVTAMGFYIQNPDRSFTLAAKEFTATFDGNRIVFAFKPGFIFFGNPQTASNIENTQIFLNALTQGDQTYVFKYAAGVYEFYNPCTNTSFVLFADE